NWLRDKSLDIARRVAYLTDRVAEDPPEWAHDLGPMPADPVAQAHWKDRAGQVAAYRERWQVPDSDTRLLGPANVRGVRARHYALVAAFRDVALATPNARPAPATPAHPAAGDMDQNLHEPTDRAVSGVGLASTPTSADPADIDVDPYAEQP